jgi:hypothetical protein
MLRESNGSQDRSQATANFAKFACEVFAKFFSSLYESCLASQNGKI